MSQLLHQQHELQPQRQLQKQRNLEEGEEDEQDLQNLTIIRLEINLCKEEEEGVNDEETIKQIKNFKKSYLK